MTRVTGSYPRVYQWQCCTDCVGHIVLNHGLGGRGRLREKSHESAVNDGRNDKANDVDSPGIGSSGDIGGREDGDGRPRHLQPP